MPSSSQHLIRKMGSGILDECLVSVLGVGAVAGAEETQGGARKRVEFFYGLKQFCFLRGGQLSKCSSAIGV